MLGWLILKPLRHVTSLADLNADEAARLGPLTQRVSAALTAELACSKVYLANFAEGPNSAHIHFHVVPRPPDADAEFRGPRVFGLWTKAQADGNLAPMTDVTVLAARLRGVLQ